MFCCARGNQAKVVGLAIARMRANAGRASALAAVREAAAELGIGLTPHETVIKRAFAAVQVVDDQIIESRRNGGMKELNAEFKAARKAGDVLRYQDFLRQEAGHAGRDSAAVLIRRDLTPAHAG
jgi:hypothetical protein